MEIKDQYRRGTGGEVDIIYLICKNRPTGLGDGNPGGRERIIRATSENIVDVINFIKRQNIPNMHSTIGHFSYNYVGKEKALYLVYTPCVIYSLKDIKKLVEILTKEYKEQTGMSIDIGLKFPTRVEILTGAGIPTREEYNIDKSNIAELVIENILETVTDLQKIQM